MKSNLLALVIVGIIIVVLLSSVQREYFDSTALSTTSGTTTGGSSASSLGTTAGNTSTNGMQVYGPQFTELGTPAKGDTISTPPENLTYPVLYGPNPAGGGRIEPGLGVVDVSKNVTLAQSGTLPSTGQLASDEKAKYLPYSRVPGDQDPYNMNANFTTSSYSSKKEPVPFLTDFSAFMK